MAADTKASAKALWAHTPTKSDEAPVPVEGHEGFSDQKTERADFALRIVEGESFAIAWLGRVRARSAEPGELETLVQFMHDGELLRGFCRSVEKALGDAHHA